MQPTVKFRRDCEIIELVRCGQRRDQGAFDARSIGDGKVSHLPAFDDGLLLRVCGQGGDVQALRF